MEQRLISPTQRGRFLLCKCNRASETERTQKNRPPVLSKGVFWMKRKFTLILILQLMVLFTSCGKSFSLIIDKAQWKSYSVEELIVLYESLNVRYQDVAVIVMENNTIKQIMIDSKEEVVSIDSIMEKEYFSDEEWQKVEDLFRTTGMNRIERSIKSGKDAIIFIYRNSNNIFIS